MRNYEILEDEKVLKKLSIIFSLMYTTVLIFSTLSVSPVFAATSYGISLSVVNQSGVTYLGWKHSADDYVIGYNIYRSTVSGQYTGSPVNDFPLQEMKYRVSNISLGTKYYYICKAVYRSKSESSASNEVSLSIFSYPDAPQNLTATKTSAGVSLKWEQPLIGVEKVMSYDIYRKLAEQSKEDAQLIATVKDLNYLDSAMNQTLKYIYFCKVLYNDGTKSEDSNEAPIEDSTNKISIVLKIGNPYMVVNGQNKEIDPGKGTSPQLINNVTMLPIRAVIEAFGGKVEWLEAKSQITITLGSNVLIAWIDKKIINVNGIEKKIDNAPTKINNRSFFPLRIITESLGCKVVWNQETKEVIITYIKNNQIVIGDGNYKITVDDRAMALKQQPISLKHPDTNNGVVLIPLTEELCNELNLKVTNGTNTFEISHPDSPDKVVCKKVSDNLFTQTVYYGDEVASFYQQLMFKEEKGTIFIQSSLLNNQMILGLEVSTDVSSQIVSINRVGRLLLHELNVLKNSNVFTAKQFKMPLDEFAQKGTTVIYELIDTKSQGSPWIAMDKQSGCFLAPISVEYKTLLDEIPELSSNTDPQNSIAFGNQINVLVYKNGKLKWTDTLTLNLIDKAYNPTSFERQAEGTLTLTDSKKILSYLFKLYKAIGENLLVVLDQSADIQKTEAARLIREGNVATPDGRKIIAAQLKESRNKMKQITKDKAQCDKLTQVFNLCIAVLDLIESGQKTVSQAYLLSQGKIKLEDFDFVNVLQVLQNTLEAGESLVELKVIPEKYGRVIVVTRQTLTILKGLSNVFLTQKSDTERLEAIFDLRADIFKLGIEIAQMNVVGVLFDVSYDTMKNMIGIVDKMVDLSSLRSQYLQDGISRFQTAVNYFHSTARDSRRLESNKAYSFVKSFMYVLSMQTSLKQMVEYTKKSGDLSKANIFEAISYYFDSGAKQKLDFINEWLMNTPSFYWGQFQQLYFLEK